MSEKELQELIEILYPYFLKKFESERIFKNCIKSINATVSQNNPPPESNIGQTIYVKLPYDTEEISVVNKSTSDLNAGDLVCLHYNIDLKNAYIAYKV